MKTLLANLVKYVVYKLIVLNFHFVNILLHDYILLYIYIVATVHAQKLVGFIDQITFLPNY